MVKKTLLHDAACKGDVNEIMKLIKTLSLHDKDEIKLFTSMYSSQKRLDPLHWATSKGQDKAIPVLHSLGADLEAKNNHDATPLLLAAQYAHDSTILVLRELGANFEAKDKNCAAAGGKISNVLILFKLGAKDDVKNNKGQTPFDVAKAWGNTALVAKWNDIKAQMITTPLHEAANKGNVNEIMKLSKTLSVHDKDERGETPLHIAAKFGQDKCVPVLHSLGADLEAVSNHDATPLLLAAQYAHDSTILVLYELGSNFEAKDKDGDNALNCAAAGGKEANVFILFKLGAKEAINNKGRTAIDVASAYGKTALIPKWNDIKAQALREKEAENKKHLEVLPSIVNDKKESKELLVEASTKHLDTDPFLLWVKAYKFDSILALMKEIGITYLFELEFLVESDIAKLLDILPHQLQKKMLLRQLSVLKENGFKVNTDILSAKNLYQSANGVDQEVFDVFESNLLSGFGTTLYDKFGFIDFDDLTSFLEKRADVEKILLTECSIPKIKVKRVLDLLSKRASTMTPPTPLSTNTLLPLPEQSEPALQQKNPLSSGEEQAPP